MMHVRPTTVTVILAAALTTAGCGSGQPRTVTDLHDMVTGAGVSCEVFSQGDPSGRSAGHGSCSPRDDSDRALGLGLDVYDSDADRDAEVSAYQSAPVRGGCLVWGAGWSVWLSEGRTVQSGDASRLVDQLDAQTDCKG